MEIDLKNIYGDMFPEGSDLSAGLSVHLHSGQVGGADGAVGVFADDTAGLCGKVFTKGHYDPDAASSARDEGKCMLNSGDIYPAPHYEIGDISGSEGKVPFSYGTATKYIEGGTCPGCNDQYLNPTEDPSGTSKTWYSVVFHASDGARILCANLLKED